MDDKYKKEIELKRRCYAVITNMRMAMDAIVDLMEWQADGFTLGGVSVDERLELLSRYEAEMVDATQRLTKADFFQYTPELEKNMLNQIHRLLPDTSNQTECRK